MNQEIKPCCGPPSETEINSRLEKVQGRLDREGLDFYLAFDPANVFYLTNFANYVHERPFILLVPVSGRPIFIMPKLEEPHVSCRAVGNIEFLSYDEFPAPKGRQWSDKLTLALNGAKRVGVEHGCPFNVVQALDGKPVPSDAIETVREIKSEYEIARITYTSKLLSEGHRMFLSQVRPGRMIVELHGMVRDKLTRKLILDNPNTNMLNTKFNGIAQPPAISHDPHNFTDVFMTFAQGGPHVTIVNGLANGYGAEVERTFFINHVPEAAKKPFDDMLAARQLAFELTVPGADMAEVDRKVNALLISRGYEASLLHRTGHSFGVSDHEGPFLADGAEGIIQPGMVFSIEPGIYLPGIGGFRFSDTVLITQTGSRKLTSAPETLEELTIKRSGSIKDSLKNLAVKAALLKSGKNKKE